MIGKDGFQGNGKHNVLLKRSVTKITEKAPDCLESLFVLIQDTFKMWPQKLMLSRKEN